MRWALHIAAAVTFLAAVAMAADQPQNVPLVPCPAGNPGGPVCQPSKKDLKEAASAFKQALKLQKDKHPDEAYDEFQHAARLSPRNLNYITALDMAREELVYDHLQQGNNALLQKNEVKALAEFRAALQIDPTNKFAQQRIQDTIAEWAPTTSDQAYVVAESREIHVAPQPVHRSFHFRGDSRMLLTQVAAAYGIKVDLDDSVVSRHVWFDIDNVGFATAIQAACDVTKAFWTPMEQKEILVAADNPANHREFDRMAMRTFYLPGLSTPAEMGEINNLLRTILGIRFLTPELGSSELIVRAPQRSLDAATQLLENLDNSRPEILLDMKLFEINHTLTRSFGLSIPNQFQLYNIPAGALAALGGQNIQQLINQLISGGGINQSDSTALSALLAQLQSQQSSIFSQPLATFGWGKTLMGLALGTGMAQLSLNESSVKDLEHATLRASDGNETSFQLGSRIPVLNASFAPIYNTPAIAQVLQNSTYQAPFPSFNYEDIGLEVKAKPTITSNHDVVLKLQVQFRSLLGQSLNGVPIISNREYEGSIALLNGEPAVVAGSLTQSDQRSLGGIPGLGSVPLLDKAMVDNNKQEEDDELLLVITPEIVSGIDHSHNQVIWLDND
jgi:general secretion pathway protein D